MFCTQCVDQDYGALSVLAVFKSYLSWVRYLDAAGGWQWINCVKPDLVERYLIRGLHTLNNIFIYDLCGEFVRNFSDVC